MKNFLFPQKLKALGWVLFVPAIIVAILIFIDVISLSGLAESIVNDAVIIGIALGALFIVCSKAKNEDEMTQAIRLNTLLSSVYFYVAIIIIGTLIFNSIEFLIFTIVCLAFLPIIYVIIFNVVMYRYNHISEDEE